MKLRLAALLFCASATGCKPGPTTLALSIDAASGVTVQSLTLHLDLGGDDAGVSEALPPSGAMPTLPGRAVVRLPDVAMDVAVSLDGRDSDGAPLHADTIVRTVPHHEVSASLTLGSIVTMGDDMNGPADLAVPIDAGLPCIAGARCNYQYRRQLIIHNGAATPLAVGYTVRVPLDTTTFPSTKTRADLADVRVFRDPPAGELPRVIDTAPPGQGRALWLALAQPIAAGASDTSYSIYYGDATATSPPQNPALVFALWDGFDSGTVPSATLWTNNPASTGASVGGGNLTLHQNLQEAIMTGTNDNVPTLSVLEWRSKMTVPSSAGQVTANGTFWWWVGYQDDFTPQPPWIIWIQRSGGPVDVHGERKISSSTVCMNGCNTTAQVVDANFHVYRIERDANETRWFYDGMPAGGSPVADPNNSDHPIMLRNWAATSDLLVDWIRARALASPEPTVTIGAETIP
ncbi:MAG TPA: hypothetical protein VF334_18665 [Polyangia bacterium]